MRDGWRVLRGGTPEEEPAGRVRCARCGEFIPMQSTRCVHCGTHFQGYAFQFTHPSERPARAPSSAWLRVLAALVLLALLAPLLAPFLAL